MKILRHERGNTSTIIYLEKEEGVHAHCIPDGVLEDRQEAWELPEDVDPLEVVLVESHMCEEEFDPFCEQFQENRDRFLKLVREKGKEIQGDKAGARQAATLPEAVGRRLRKRLREEFQVARQVASGNYLESNQIIQDDLKGIRKGFEKLAEERLADDIIGANPGLKMIPREVREEPQLEIKIVEGS